jgi:hypothetical protein
MRHLPIFRTKRLSIFRRFALDMPSGRVALDTNCVLQAHPGVLRSLLASGIAEGKTGVVSSLDLRPHVFRALLSFTLPIPFSTTTTYRTSAKLQTE